jgi:hypothetical protein
MSAMRRARPLRASSEIHSAPARVLPAPRPPRKSQVRQSPSGGFCSARAQKLQSQRTCLSSQPLKYFSWSACKSGVSEAKQAASEFFAQGVFIFLRRLGARERGKLCDVAPRFHQSRDGLGLTLRQLHVSRRERMFGFTQHRFEGRRAPVQVALRAPETFNLISGNLISGHA